MNVSVAEVLAGAAAHAVPLTAECVGYLVLGAADQVLGAPRSLGAGDLLLSEDGAVRVAGGRAAQAEDAERDLRALLDALLLCASSASAGLMRASRRKAGNGIPGLVRELETALIPVNRAAAKRSLARLQRETCRALESGRIRLEESAAAPVVAPPVVAPPIAPPVPVAAVIAPTPALPMVAPVLPAPIVEASSSEPLPSVALPPVLPATVSEIVPVSVTAERPDHTVVLAEVAPRALEPSAPPQLAETRPEPVVRRASQRPTARPVAETVEAAEPGFVDSGHTVPLPPVTVPNLAALASALLETPLLGTRIFSPIAPSAALAMEAEADASDARAEASDVQAEASDVQAGASDVQAGASDVQADASDDDDLEIVVVEEPPVAEMRADDADGLIEVIFEEDERTVFPADHELLYVDSDARDAGDTTDPCPALAAESLLPPPCEVATAAPPPNVAPIAEPEPEPVAQIAEPSPALPPVAPRDEARAPVLAASEVELAANEVELAANEVELAANEVELAANEVELAANEVELAANEVELAASEVEPAPSEVELAVSDVELAPSEVELAPSEVELDASEVELDASEVELAALVESALPPWTREEAPVLEVTPPPRVALPEQRRSDVQDLLLRLAQAPLAVDELRSGLKRLAGLDLTPPPPGTLGNAGE